MKPQSFIFIGRSGAGKGTQADLLMKALKEKDPKRSSLYIQSGGELRKFIQGASYTQNIAKKLYDTGALMAEFLVIDMWVSRLVEYYTGEEHLVFDGTPRKFHEAGVFDSIFGFYGLPKPWVINIVISQDEALKRLMARKRIDDNEEEIRKRLGWYETDVAPTVEYYRRSSNVQFFDIDGERSIEEIHADIVKKLGLS